MNYRKVGEFIVLVDDVLNLYKQKEEILNETLNSSRSEGTSIENVRQLDVQIETKMRRIKSLSEEN